MKQFPWHRWFKSLFSSPPPRLRRRSKQFQPHLEYLEGRITPAQPAVFTWTGASIATNTWTDPNNWKNANNAPAVPTAGSQLVFPASTPVNPVKQFISLDNFPTGTAFDSIVFQAGGYTLNGSSTVTLTPSGGQGLIDNAPTNTTNTINLPLRLAINAAAPLTNQQTFFVANSGSTLNLAGTLTNTVQMTSLLKSGQGILELSANNSPFTASITAGNNSGIIEIAGFNTALGSSPTPVTIQTGSQLAVASVNGKVANNLVLNGPGPSNDGALLAISGSTNVWAGTVKLDSNTTVGATFVNGSPSVLTIQGQIFDTGAGASLTKEGPGTIVLDPLVTGALSPANHNTYGNAYRGLTIINNGVLAITQSQALGLDPNLGYSQVTVQALQNEQGTLQLGWGGITGAFQTISARGGTEPNKHIDPRTGQEDGFDVVQTRLTITGLGYTGLGALYNGVGDNAWENTITLVPGSIGNTASIGVALEAIDPITGAITNLNNLTIDGLVTDSAPILAGSLTKLQPGRLLLTNVNNYTGVTTVMAGALTMQNSLALGSPTLGSALVVPGASLELQAPEGLVGFVDPKTGLAKPNATGFNSSSTTQIVDPVTNNPNMLKVSKSLFLEGLGFTDPITKLPVGALHSIAGINEWVTPITLATSKASIGVDSPSQNFLPNSTESANDDFINKDWRLIVSNAIGGDPVVYTTLFKLGTGGLVLTAANQLPGIFEVWQGWVGVENNQALGVRTDQLLVNPYQYGDSQQPATIVKSGAALFLIGTTGNLDIHNNLILSGDGISHNDPTINHQGALINLAGDNTIDFDGSITLLQSPVTASNPNVNPLSAGIGSALLNPPTTPKTWTTSKLTVAAPVTDQLNTQYIRTGDTSDTTFRIPTPPPSTGNDILPVSRSFLGTTPVNLTGNTAQGSNTITNLASVSALFVGMQVIAPSNPFLFPINTFITSINPATLTITISTSATTTLVNVPLTFSVTADDFFVDSGATNASIIINYNSNTWTNQLGVTYGGFFTTTTQLLAPVNIAGSGSTTTIQPLVYNGPDTFFDIQLTPVSPTPPVRINTWGYTVEVIPAPTPAITLAKYGGMSVVLLGANRFRGGVDIKAGSLEIHNSTALGTPSITINGSPLPIIVEAGAALIMGQSTPQTSGGLTAGTQFDNTINLILNGGGDSTTVPGATIASLTVLSGDNLWRGNVTLNTSTVLDVAQGARLTIAGVVDDAPNVSSPNGSALTINPSIPGDIASFTGELVLTNSNTYRGGTNVNQGILNIQNNNALGGTVVGTVVKAGASLELQGNLNIAGQPLTIEGQGPSTFPSITTNWFGIGPSNISNGETEKSSAVSGWVTSIISDPNDPNVIYVGTNGGGLWNTRDGGQTWHALFDKNNPTALLFVGAITLDPVDSRVVYVGTGVGDNNPDSFAGNGVWMSVDTGRDWSQLIGNNGNPLLGGAVTGIAVSPDPANTPLPLYNSVNGTGIAPLVHHPLDNVVFVSVSDLATNGAFQNGITGVAGVWRWNRNATTNWVNMVATGIAFDQGTVGIPNPNVVFPVTMADYSDVILDLQNPFGEPILYFALSGNVPLPGVGSPLLINSSFPPFFAGQTTGINAMAGVYRTDMSSFNSPVSFPRGDPNGGFDTSGFFGGPAAIPLYTANTGLHFIIGSGTQNSQRGVPFVAFGNTPFPNLIDDPLYNEDPVPGPDWGNGLIKIALSYGTSTPSPQGANRPYVPGRMYAMITNSDNRFLNGRYGHVFDLWESVPTWIPVGNQIFLAPIGFDWTNTDYIQTSSPIVPPDYMTGFGAGSGTGFVYSTIAVDQHNANIVYLGSVGEPPAGGKGTLGVLETTDGGVTWNNIQTAGSNFPHQLDHAMFVDATTDRLLLGTEGGLWQLSDPTVAGPTWTNLNGNTALGNNGLQITNFESVAVDPTDPSILIAGSRGNGLDYYQGDLLPTTAPGNWTEVLPTVNSSIGDVLIDPLNPQLMYAVLFPPNTDKKLNGTIYVSTTGGAGPWTPLLPKPNPSLADVTKLVLETLNTNPSQPTRLLAASSGVIYEYNPTGSGTGTAAWIPLNSPGIGSIVDIAQATYQGDYFPDPDFNTGTISVPNQGASAPALGTIYTISNNTVAVTENAGNNWVSVDRNNGLSGTLTSIVVDPSNSYHAFVLATTGLGPKGPLQQSQVYETVDAGHSWNPVGTPINFNASKLVFDYRDRTLYVATDSGVWRYSKNDVTPIWARFGAGLADTKVTDLDLQIGNNILTASTYGRGVYQLSLDTHRTTPVDPLNQNTFYGALRVVTGTAVWGGPVTLTGNTYIRADGTQALGTGLPTASFDITGTISDTTTNPSSPALFRLVKIGKGDVTLGGSNTYTGQTDIREGNLIADNPNALSGSDTVVEDNASLVLTTSIQNEPLTLNGSGSSQINNHFSGALFNLSGNNTYTGVIILATPTVTIGTASNTSLTIAASSVAMTGNTTQNSTLITNLPSTLGLLVGMLVTGPGVPADTFIATINPAAGSIVLSNPATLTQPGASLTFAATIEDTLAISPPATLVKEGTGTLILQTANSYNRNTTVQRGALELQNGGALGLPGNQTQVVNGATLVLAPQSGTGITIAGQTLDVTGTGNANQGAVVNLSGNNSWTGPVIFDIVQDILPSPAPTPLVGINVVAGLLSIGGSVSGSTTSPQLYRLDKTGQGTLIFNQDNTYGGGSLIEAGTLQFATNNGLGFGDATVNFGGSLQLNPTIPGITVSNRLFLSGDGSSSFPNQTGVLESLAGANTWTGLITLLSNSSIGVDGTSQLTIPAGAPGITDGGSGFSLTKAGTGTLSFQNTTNSYSGMTVIQNGILDIEANKALGTTSGVLVQSQNGQNGTLQLQSNGAALNITNVPLTINGPGAAGSTPGQTIGALTNKAGNNTWTGNILLGLSSSLGVVQGTDTFTINGAILDQGSGVTKFGSGSLSYSGTASNTYTGLTVISAGQLILNKTGGAVALAGSVQVGTGSGVTPPATLLDMGSGEIAAGGSATVNSDGVFNLSDHSEALVTLQINDGKFTTGSSSTGNLALSNLIMQGGSLTLGTAGSKVTVNTANGSLTGSSSSTSTAAISGSGGILSLTGANPIITVNAGSQTVDLAISTPISGTGGLIKQGAGLLQINSTANSYPGTTNIQVGTVQVDGTIGNVVLNGGTLSGGSGTVGTVTSSTGGAVFPADASSNPAIPNGGTLNSGAVNLNSASTFLVDVNGPDGVPGVVNGLLNVNGSINLGNASLDGIVNSAGFSLGNVVTIIHATGGVSGKFNTQANNVAFVGGVKFKVLYLTNDVQLQRDQVKINMSLAAADATTLTPLIPSAALYGQPIVFLATITSGESFSGQIAPIPNGQATVDFIVNGQSSTKPVTVNVVNNQAILDPRNPAVRALLGNMATPDGLIVGQFDVTADLNGPAITSGTFAKPPTQGASLTINAASTIPNVVGSLNPASYADFNHELIVTATINSASPSVAIPTGTVTFTIDGNTSPSFTGLVLTNGQTSIDLGPQGLNLPAGTHTIDVSYSPSNGNFLSSKASSVTPSKVLSEVISKATTVITVAPNTFNPTFGNQIFLNAVITPAASLGATGKIIPTGTVTFLVNGTPLPGTSTVDPASGTVTLGPITTLPGGSDSITAIYSGDANFSTSTTATATVINVAQANVNVSFTTSNLNPTYNSPAFTITATLSPSNGQSIQATGTVTFFVDGVAVPGAVNLTAANAGVVKLQNVTPSSLGVGQHVVTIQYSGDQNYNAIPNLTGNTTSGSQLVTNLSSVSSLFVGMPVNGAGIPSGTKISSITPATNSITLSAAATATATNVSLTFSSALIQGVSSPTVTQLTVSPTTTTTFGQPVTFTATVTGTAPFAISPTTGTVTFTIPNSSKNGTAVNVGPNGVATLTVTDLPAGTSQVTASYNAGTTVGFGNSVSSPVQATVNRASTTTVLSSPSNSGMYGQTLTLTATVSVVPPGAGTPVGTVLFNVPGLTLQPTPVNLVPGSIPGTAIATLPLNNAPVGSPSITATYQPATLPVMNFNGSKSSTFTLTISQASTTTVLAASPDPSTFGQAVTLTATVSASSSPQAVIAGSVAFFVNNVQSGLPVKVNSATGKATLTLTNLHASSQTSIFAKFLANGNLAGSTSNTVKPTVQKANSSVALTSSAPNGGTVGTSVTITALVTGTAPSSGPVTAGSTISYQVINLSTSATVLSGSAPLASTGKATFSLPASLTAGNYSVQVTYNGSGDFIGSSQTLTQKLGQKTTTTMTFSGGTFTIKVTAGAFGTPGGSVNLTIDGNVLLQNEPLNASGQVFFTPNSPLAGRHTLVATYNGDDASGLLNGSSFSLTQTFIGPATQLVLTSQKTLPVGTVMKVPFTLTLTVEDAAGDPVVSYSNNTQPVNLTLLPSGGQTVLPVGAKLSGPTSLTISGGFVQFRNLSVNVAGKYLIQVDGPFGTFTIPLVVALPPGTRT